MSTEIGGKAVAGGLVDESKALIDAAVAEEEQLDLLAPVTPEEKAWAQEELGPNAGNLAVLKHAREKRGRGRPKNSRNRRTDDFENYIRQFGQDPAITLMQIQSTPEEVHVERSRQMDPVKRRLSYGDAQALRVRCAEALMPYLHGKKPVTADLNIRGVIVQEQIGDVSRIAGSAAAAIDGVVLGVMRDAGGDSE